MFYSNINNQIHRYRSVPMGPIAVTQSAAQITVQSVQEVLQVPQPMYQYYPVEYYYPVYSTSYGAVHLTIPYGTVYNL